MIDYYRNAATGDLYLWSTSISCACRYWPSFLSGLLFASLLFAMYTGLVRKENVTEKKCVLEV